MRLSAFAVAAVTVCVAACDPAPLPHACGGVGYWALEIGVVDGAGNPIAFGSTVTLYEGTYVERDSGVAFRPVAT